MNETKGIISKYEKKIIEKIFNNEETVKEYNIFLLERLMYQRKLIDKYPNLKRVLAYMHNESLSNSEKEEILLDNLASVFEEI